MSILLIVVMCLIVGFIVHIAWHDEG